MFHGSWLMLVWLMARTGWDVGHIDRIVVRRERVCACVCPCVCLAPVGDGKRPRLTVQSTWGFGSGGGLRVSLPPWPPVYQF